MPEISAKDVMALRNQTGLSMMECKKALQEANGDAAAAEELLKKKMKGKMDTRTDRAAGEGRIAIALSKDGRNAAIVELRAETDFTAKNDAFVNAAQKVADMALASNAGDVSPSGDMTKVIDDLRISTGENISIGRVHKAEGGGNTMFGTYIHHDGKTGVLLQAEGSVSQDLAREICMHITAAVPRPKGVTRDDVPQHVIDKERRLAMEMAMEGGKNEEIAAKMVEGKINKLYSELALLEQPFIKDDTKKIKDLLPKGSTVTAFYRWQVGEAAD
ncbi:MAG: translation elongation factor Ts [Phycisphaeraceae bacterium]|nr:translation elongation factor Ts [Phycisphaerales bacterium]MCB9843714.1 translation elongation factor Ts [Phycisphaeraceae bacterium]